jgi:succinate dehydrogenase subunit D
VPRSREPFFWVLFSSGGMLAALFLPALVLILWIAMPVGWVEVPSYSALVDKLRPPVVRLSLFVLISLSLFHWGHRFRYTLYDGLQLEHLYGLIAAFCYGGATALTIVAARVLWAFP